VLSQLIALAFTRPNRSIALPTTPGRKLDFRGGCAHVFDERDLHTLFQRDDIILEFQQEWAERVPGWLNSLGELKTPKADIRLPEGMQLEGKWPDWHFAGRDPVVAVVEEAVAEPEDEYHYDLDSDDEVQLELPESFGDSWTDEPQTVPVRPRGRPRKVNA
jgi:hypothetical protein